MGEGPVLAAWLCAARFGPGVARGASAGAGVAPAGADVASVGAGTGVSSASTGRLRAIAAMIRQTGSNEDLGGATEVPDHARSGGLKG
jgi:hypothetical protein